jgi:hypothetical protein
VVEHELHVRSLKAEVLTRNYLRHEFPLNSMCLAQLALIRAITMRAGEVVPGNAERGSSRALLASAEQLIVYRMYSSLCRYMPWLARLCLACTAHCRRDFFFDVIAAHIERIIREVLYLHNNSGMVLVRSNI